MTDETREGLGADESWVEEDGPLAELPENPPFSPRVLREHRWWVERFGIDDPTRLPVHDVDPRDLGSAGWGVVFAPDIDPAVREALQPLLDLRRSQAGALYREFTLAAGVTKSDFLTEQRVAPGPADPRRVPYYLMLVGDPERIPFQFQYEMDVQYGVGRLEFESPESYAHYAESVVHAETRLPTRPKRMVFFAPANPGDPATQGSSQEFAAPLVKRLLDVSGGWETELAQEATASKARLSRLLGDGETPSFLLAAGHGIGTKADHPFQKARQGALLCQDWPGRPHGASRDMYFTADDVGEDADLQGLIALFLAEYSAGTPELDDFHFRSPSEEPYQVAPRSFLAALPQRLLGHPRGGALAVVGHIDRIWNLGSTMVRLFEALLRKLLVGYPIGAAMEPINQRYAELAVELTSFWKDRNSRIPARRERLIDLWTSCADLRNYIVLGDPAVRLSFRNP